MKSLDDRIQAQEAEYAHNDKLSFEVEARGSKLFGLWVAKQIGLDDEACELYAKTVVEANLEEAGFDDILRKVRADLDEKEIDISDHILNTELQNSMREAQRQIHSEG